MIHHIHCQLRRSRVMQTHLQLSLWRLEGREQQVSDIPGCFVEKEAHPLASETFGNDVELYTMPHISLSSTQILNYAGDIDQKKA